MLTISKVNFNKTYNAGVANNSYENQQPKINSQINKDTVSFGRADSYNLDIFTPLGDELNALRKVMINRLSKIANVEISKIKDEASRPWFPVSKLVNTNKDGSEVLIQGFYHAPYVEVTKNGEKVRYHIPEGLSNRTTYSMSKIVRGNEELMRDKAEVKAFIDTVNEALEAKTSESRILF